MSDLKLLKRYTNSFIDGNGKKYDLIVLCFLIIYPGC